MQNWIKTKSQDSSVWKLAKQEESLINGFEKNRKKCRPRYWEDRLVHFKNRKTVLTFLQLWNQSILCKIETTALGMWFNMTRTEPGWILECWWGQVCYVATRIDWEAVLRRERERVGGWRCDRICGDLNPEERRPLWRRGTTPPLLRSHPTIFFSRTHFYIHRRGHFFLKTSAWETYCLLKEKVWFGVFSTKSNMYAYY